MSAALAPVKAAWTGAALLPLPALLMIDPGVNAELSCVYLGLASAWLAIEILRTGGMPDSRSTWGAKIGALGLALLANLALFLALALSVSVRSKFPFALMAALSVVPALGLVPWLTLRLRKPYLAIVVSALILFVAKLLGCAVARVVYGPNFAAEGRIGADWQIAAVMISTFWIVTIAISLGMLAAGFAQFKRHPPPSSGV